MHLGKYLLRGWKVGVGEKWGVEQVSLEDSRPVTLREIVPSGGPARHSFRIYSCWKTSSVFIIRIANKRSCLRANRKHSAFPVRAGFAVYGKQSGLKGSMETAPRPRFLPFFYAEQRAAGGRRHRWCQDHTRRAESRSW